MSGLISSLFQSLLALALHEAAHAIAARAYGLAVRRVGINWIGPYVVRERSQIGSINAVVSLAGPAANFVLAVVFCRMAPEFASTNFWLGLLNALPFIPASDGKRAWRALRGEL